MTVHGKVSDDGMGLVVLGMDGADTDESSEPDGDEDMASDDDSNPGDRWDKMMNGGQ